MTTPRRDIYVPPGGPANAGKPDPEIFARMGEANIARMLEDFYEELGRSKIATLFPADPAARSEASHKSAAFFVFILGGPPLYHQRHGSPMMRARHIPFVIDEPARREWLRCFHLTLDKADEKYGFPMQHMPGFLRFLDGFSAWMVNTAGPDSPPMESNSLL